ncbi:hypothetical protein ACFV46_23475 [Streptomyces sp. NPDC059852]|uniref:hypothetical protein n=1 Tax=Streptomyces sp. NPDC059852 TaxID=3346972 RepID=UPI0036508F0F
MEQRIGSGSRPLVEGAGFDPAFVPGLTPPASAAPKGPQEKDGTAVADSDETVPEDAAETAEKVDKDAEFEEPGETEDVPEDAVADEAPVDGPVFEAADRRARIVADHRGVRLRLDDQECEFRWDEIAAVETESPRFGKRFTITVHTPDRRWYPIEIEATARSRFTEWDEQLDAVLDAYFEEGAAEEAQEAAAAAAEKE